jgi:hypothetical protein
MMKQIAIFVLYLTLGQTFLFGQGFNQVSFVDQFLFRIAHKPLLTRFHKLPLAIMAKVVLFPVMGLAILLYICAPAMCTVHLCYFSQR